MLFRKTPADEVGVFTFHQIQQTSIKLHHFGAKPSEVLPLLAYAQQVIALHAYCRQFLLVADHEHATIPKFYQETFDD